MITVLDRRFVPIFNLILFLVYKRLLSTFSLRFIDTAEVWYTCYLLVFAHCIPRSDIAVWLVLVSNRLIHNLAHVPAWIRVDYYVVLHREIGCGLQLELDVLLVEHPVWEMWELRLLVEVAVWVDVFIRQVVRRIIWLYSHGILLPILVLTIVDIPVVSVLAKVWWPRRWTLIILYFFTA